MKRFLSFLAALVLLLPATISAKTTAGSSIVKEQMGMLRTLFRQQPTSTGELAKYCTQQFLASGKPLTLTDNDPGLYGNYGMIDVEAKSIKRTAQNTYRVTFYSEEEGTSYTIVYKLKKEGGRWKIDSMQRQ